MKYLIVYYSLEGNTKYVAEKVAEKTGADLLCLVPEKAYPTGAVKKYVFGGRSAMRGEAPTLKPYSVNLDEYEGVILMTPVWAGTFAPPLRTFMMKNDLSGKRTAFVACCGGSKAEGCMKDLEKLSKTKPVATLMLVRPYAKPSEKNEAELDEFCRMIRHTAL